MRRNHRRRPGRRRGQGMTEVIILAALAALVLVWTVTAFPRAIKTHYVQNVQMLASPF